MKERKSLEALKMARERLQGWLFDGALPLWWRNGRDQAGGFHDKLSIHDASPIHLPKRVRVQARQIIVYAVAGRLGWQGPWAEAVEHGLSFLEAYRRNDGLYRVSVDELGRPAVDKPDLYDQAFVLFALAAGFGATGKPELKRRALDLVDRLDLLLRHPHSGYEEARPRELPLRSNPHMHLLEALLGWIEEGEGGIFKRRAIEIVALALDRLIDPATGAIGEFYDGDWRFAPSPQGAVREPGHQFEWAYLLHLAGRLLHEDNSGVADALEAFGTRYGVRNGRVVFALDANGAVIDASSRLWAQTERLRTTLTLATTAKSQQRRALLLNGALEAVATIEQFLDVEKTGLWRERIDSKGRWIDEPVPASSLYHIVTGLAPLLIFQLDDVRLRSPNW